jgi:hypothetical protein
MLPKKSMGLIVSLGALCIPGAGFADPVIIVCFRSETIPLLSQSGGALNAKIKAPAVGNGIPADYDDNLIHFTLNHKPITISADNVQIRDPKKEIAQVPPPGGASTFKFHTKGLGAPPPAKPSTPCQ